MVMIHESAVLPIPLSIMIGSTQGRVLQARSQVVAPEP